MALHTSSLPFFYDSEKNVKLYCTANWHSTEYSVELFQCHVLPIVTKMFVHRYARRFSAFSQEVNWNCTICETGDMRVCETASESDLPAVYMRFLIIPGRNLFADQV